MTMTSIHSKTIDEVYDVPMEVIRRPLQSVLDEDKVASLMDTIKVSEAIEPIHTFLSILNEICTVPTCSRKLISYQ